PDTKVKLDSTLEEDGSDDTKVKLDSTLEEESSDDAIDTDKVFEVFLSKNISKNEAYILELTTINLADSHA
ncbi:hypothetical protein ACJMK2_010338, partial [Sinanodonta woodiana]